ncbi:hypothetical protein ECC43_03840 [Helicobacter pylori]|nr:hypothetical protein ECC43_03840 [Helicobacter pylori]
MAFYHVNFNLFSNASKSAKKWGFKFYIDNSAELNHASENYDELKDFIKRFQLKHDSVALLELESFETRAVSNDKAVLLDFVL